MRDPGNFSGGFAGAPCRGYLGSEHGKMSPQGHLQSHDTAALGCCGNEPERSAMPRKPNYRFERSERDKNKAAKKAERLQAKADKSAARKTESDPNGTEDQPE